MDLVDSQFNSLIEMTCNQDQNCSLGQLKDSHDTALRTLLHGCFQDGSKSSVTINKSILMILACIGRNCDLIEKFLDPARSEILSAQSFDSLENVNHCISPQELDGEFDFLFEVFEGIQDSSKSLLSQFLIRFDFNRWFSEAAIER
jgi:Gamma tubulin complex component C-terminal